MNYVAAGFLRTQSAEGDVGKKNFTSVTEILQSTICWPLFMEMQRCTLCKVILVEISGWLYLTVCRNRSRFRNITSNNESLDPVEPNRQKKGIASTSLISLGHAKYFNQRWIETQDIKAKPKLDEKFKKRSGESWYANSSADKHYTSTESVQPEVVWVH